MPVPGLVAVAGGKYTTYRVMARDAVDAAARGLDAVGARRQLHRRRRRWSAPTATRRCGTGAAGWPSESGLHLARIEHLLHRYGSRIHELLDEVARRPELGRPLEGADDYLRVEACYAASHEGALHLDDVLARRTRISIETWDRGLRAAEPGARLMAEVLGWSEEDDRARGRALPRARRGRARLPAPAGRPGRRRGPHAGGRRGGRLTALAVRRGESERLRAAGRARSAG